MVARQTVSRVTEASMSRGEAVRGEKVMIGDSRSVERLRRWRRGVRRRVEDAGEARANGRDPRR